MSRSLAAVGVAGACGPPNVAGLLFRATGALIAPAGPTGAGPTGLRGSKSGAGGVAVVASVAAPVPVAHAFRQQFPWLALAFITLAPVVGGVCIRACGGIGDWCCWVSPQPVRPSPATANPPTWNHFRSVRVRIAVLPFMDDLPEPSTDRSSESLGTSSAAGWSVIVL